MENASKALLMAAGMLIAIMIISLMVYLFVVFGSYSKGVHKENDEKALAEFNVQYTKYENQDYLTIQDVVTILNLARNNNLYHNIETPPVGNAALTSYYILVQDINTNPQLKLEEKLRLSQSQENEYNKQCSDLIKDNITNKYKFKYKKSDKANGTGRVYEIIIFQ